MNAYKVRFTDGSTCIVSAISESEARWKVNKDHAGVIIQEIVYIG